MTSKKIISKKYKNWSLARRIVQGVVLVLFLLLFWMTRREGFQPEVTNVILRLDPLVMLGHLFSSRMFLAGSALSLIVLILTLLLGRAWCGWMCPLGTILDLFSFRRKKRDSKSLHPNWHRVKYAVLLLILVAALLGNLTLLFLDPLTIVYRSLTMAVYPALDRIVLAIEETLYPVPALSGIISQVDMWLRPAILPTQPVEYRAPLLFLAVFVGVILLNLVTVRFWCRYICPLGALLGLLSKVSIFKRKVFDGCISCDRCERVCPTDAVDARRSYASNAGECTLCMDCFRDCPEQVIHLAANPKPEWWTEHDPGRRESLVMMGSAVAGVALMQTDWRKSHPHPYFIQPPGGLENDLLSKCIRCGLCIRTCPTGVLQPSLTEAGLEGLWTPVLVPEIGYCDYTCNACGQVCPVEAIPPLSLEEKRLTVLGSAYIDTNRCIAWADEEGCIVCEEMCPLPQKAITLEPKEITDEDGYTFTLMLPFVDRYTCIGCGICEYKCPVEGEAAIRVRALPTAGL